MTMDDEQVDVPMTLFERKQVIETIPWVARAPKDVDMGRCEVLRHDAPHKAYWTPEWTQRELDDPVAMKYRCKHRARWVFIGISGHIRKMCWWHLWYAGLRGSMDEEARFDQWADKWETDHAQASS